MKSKISAGLLMYRCRNGGIEVFLAHPGGPFFKSKDEGYWSIPKGLPNNEEDLLKAAIREFEEETGVKADGAFIPIGEVTQKSGKVVHAWAFEGNCDESHEHQCNTFEMEWPPKSGSMGEYPEVDRVEFFPIEEARRKLIEAQVSFLDRLLERM